MDVHRCPACNGEPAKPTLAFFNTGENWRKHYAAEVTLPCQVCKATGMVSGWVLLRYHKGRKHKADRVERGETLFHAAKRIGVSSAELSAYEHGFADLPERAAAIGAGKE
ncbi:MAG TPA: helix-turn-helix transcriptional regulator [Noviherbaspirillum sp.]|nr:helix-turn-helix transcriptional regulator [Noviherbaspirillum sp.]